MLHRTMNRILNWTFLPLIIAISLSGCEEGKRVCSVHDGDTFNTCDGQRIRLAMVDAPELKQRFGKEAKKVLSSLVLNQKVTLNCSDTSYDRQVCQVGVNGKDINGEMVRLGYAFDYTVYSHGLYQEQEQSAKIAGLGVWQLADGGKRPWDYRHHPHKKRTNRTFRF